MKELEAKRKAKSAVFYAAKKRLVALRAKAVAQVRRGLEGENLVIHSHAPCAMHA